MSVPSRGQGSRPPSRTSQRPPSSISQRPPSSSGRPASSLSIRPGSRISQRPNSRLSRPATRQSSRLLPFSQTLVTQVTGLTPENDEENFRTAVEFVWKNLEQVTKAAVGVDMTVVDKQIHGIVQKAHINSREELGQALNVSYQKLKTQVKAHGDSDQEIKMTRLPDHLQFLIALSAQPTQSTFAFADVYLENWRNPPKPPPTLTWKDILSEEPFQGQHWEGVWGLPPGSTVEGWEIRSDGSSPSLSPLDDSDDLDDSLSSLDSREHPQVIETPDSPVQFARPVHAHEQDYYHREEFEKLQERQYWRENWRSDIPVTRPFDIGDASTLGPSLRRILGEDTTRFISGPEQEKYIYEQDAVREVLMGLQGRKNLFFTWTNTPDNASFTYTTNAPLLPHLTLASQASIFTSFARTATFVERLRKFTCSIFTGAWPLTDETGKSSLPTKNSGRQNTRTLEAFSEAVDYEIRSFYKWCASKEEDICRAQGGLGPPIVVSVLSLEKAIRDAFSRSFSVLVDILQKFLTRASGSQQPVTQLRILPDMPSRIPPAFGTTIMLDKLFHAVQEYLSMGDNVTADMLMRVFAKTAEPVWSMIALWLRNGMPVRDPAGFRSSYEDGSLDDEFFIEDNGLLLVDPDFWKDGYTLRGGSDEDASKTVPVFLAHVVDHVLGSGKAVGLLRALGISDDGQVWVSDWCSFTALLARETSRDLQSHTVTSNVSLFSVSTDALSRIVYDELLRHCQTMAARLTNVIIDDCLLWKHLSAIEDLFLMRRGDSMSHFADTIFGKMDGNQSWGDFHFLNTAFNDILEASSTKWVEAALVRLSYRGGHDKSINRTVKAIDGLSMEYAVPFPLTYIFGARVLQVYNSIFVFLLQIRRAKSVLERILVRGSIASHAHLGSDLKVLYAMRSKLSWFINTLLNFLTTYVIHTQISKFHNILHDVKSLDEMITLHDDHLEKVRGRCLLNSNTSALHRAIISVLDMCLHFTDFFVTFAGDTTLDISRQSMTMRRHRSRRERRRRLNVIGFSQSLQESQDSSEDESDIDEDDDDLHPPEPSFGLATTSVSSLEEGYIGRLDKMSSELDGLVRFIRRGVESFAGGTGEAAPAFGVLAFALEDWDI